MTDRHPSDEAQIEVAPTDAVAALAEQPAPPIAAFGLRLARLAAGVAVVALALAIVALAVRSRTITTTDHMPASVARGVDAAGCPIGGSCQATADPDPSLTELIERSVPSLSAIVSESVGDVPTTLTYRTTVVALQRDGGTIAVSAQCVPRGAPVPPRDDPLPAVGPADAATVVPGERGCSVAVVVHTPAGMPVPVEAARRIAQLTSVQLRAPR
jgi:hypothetical protein